MKGLRWAQGQGEHHHGTSWHLVVEDVYDNPEGYGSPLQKTACGRLLVQSDEVNFGHYMEDAIKPRSLGEFVPAWIACERCYAVRQAERPQE